jgi:hypothetical protein
MENILKSIKIFIIIFIIITIFIKLFIKSKDYFKVLSYNSLKVIDDSDLNIPDKDIIVDFLRKKYSNEEQTAEINKEQLNLVPFYTKIPIENNVRKILNNNINNELKNYQNQPTNNYSLDNSNNELYNIRWIDKENIRHFIVNYDIGFLKNDEKIFIDTFTIYFTISNISNYLINPKEYNPFNTINPNDINIQSIILTNVENFKFTPNSQLVDNKDNFYDYYYIKNKLFLLDPFITSGKEMQLVSFNSQANLERSQSGQK